MTIIIGGIDGTTVYFSKVSFYRGVKRKRLAKMFFLSFTCFFWSMKWAFQKWIDLVLLIGASTEIPSFLLFVW